MVATGFPRASWEQQISEFTSSCCVWGMSHLTVCCGFAKLSAEPATSGSGLQNWQHVWRLIPYDAQSKHCKTERTDNVWKEGFAECHWDALERWSVDTNLWQSPIKTQVQEYFCTSASLRSYNTLNQNWFWDSLIYSGSWAWRVFY